MDEFIIQILASSDILVDIEKIIKDILVYLFCAMVICVMLYFPYGVVLLKKILEEEKRKELLKTLKELRDQENAPHERYIGPLIKKKKSIEL
jgi:hypothetical protein